MIRCFHCGTVYEPCRRCRGTAVAQVAFGAKRVASPCPDCAETLHPGWQARRSGFGSPYPVS